MQTYVLSTLSLQLGRKVLKCLRETGIENQSSFIRKKQKYFSVELKNILSDAKLGGKTDSCTLPYLGLLSNIHLI